MVLTDRQREDLHAGIYEYLVSRGEAFEEAAKAFALADPKAAEKKTNNVGKTPLLEKKMDGHSATAKESLGVGADRGTERQDPRASQWRRRRKRRSQRRVEENAAALAVHKHVGRALGASDVCQGPSGLYSSGQRE